MCFHELVIPFHIVLETANSGFHNKDHLLVMTLTVSQFYDVLWTCYAIKAVFIQVINSELPPQFE
jgi:hypothetical protein